MLFICSDSTSVLVSACDGTLDVAVLRDAGESRSACFQLSGVSLFPITRRALQASSDQTFHLRLAVKEVIREDFVEKCVTANDCITDSEDLQRAPFYYRCRKCGAVILSRHL